MDANTTDNAKRIKGTSANSIMIPVIVVLIALQVLIVFLIISVDNNNVRLTDTIRRSALYTEDATNLLGGSSLLSETSTSFVLSPTTETGEPNIGPLMAYMNELSVDRRGDDVEKRFEDYQVSKEAFHSIADAADAANKLIEMQLHALSLTLSARPLPPQINIDALPLPELTPEEQAMTDEEKLAAAQKIMFGTEYGEVKFLVNSNVTACTENIKEETNHTIEDISARIITMQHILWISTLAMIVLLILVFILLYILLIQPLKNDVRLIASGSKLNENSGLLEVRKLAASYNALLSRREILEKILREAAETDTLTSLPNRYSLEQTLTETEMSEEDIPLSIGVFDVNFLKHTNDTYGHEAGDELIRKAADCISRCFGNENLDNCFRVGGDEFTVVLKDVREEQFELLVEEFVRTQKEEGLSIAWGGASTENVSETSVRTMIKQADRKMYEQKQKMHREDGPVFVPAI